MKGFKVAVLSGLSIWTLTGCTLTLTDGIYDPPKSELKESVDSSLQSICDVSRSRARQQLLKRLNIEKFRKIALKVSKEITSDEIADLQRLDPVRSAHSDLALENSRQRDQLITEIYTGAIYRAGFKPNATEGIADSPYSYTVGVDAVASGNDAFASILLGHLTKGPQLASQPDEDLFNDGRFYQLSLSANPDQSRYYVELYQLSGSESQPDGTLIPFYRTLNLFDAVAGALPHHCSQVESALNQLEFNTIPGLKSGEAQFDAPVISAPAASAPAAAAGSHDSAPAAGPVAAAGSESQQDGY